MQQSLVLDAPNIHVYSMRIVVRLQHATLYNALEWCIIVITTVVYLLRTLQNWRSIRLRKLSSGVEQEKYPHGRLSVKQVVRKRVALDTLLVYVVVQRK
jgi:hypothetical protein